MTINPIIAQWDRNERTQMTTVEQRSKRWLCEDREPKTGPQPRDARVWLPRLALKVSAVLALVLTFYYPQ